MMISSMPPPHTAAVLVFLLFFKFQIAGLNCTIQIQTRGGKGRIYDVCFVFTCLHGLLKNQVELINGGIDSKATSMVKGRVLRDEDICIWFQWIDMKFEVFLHLINF
jgi:hypothetical protein